MPLSQFQRSAFGTGRPADADHYFATVHGDVAALQVRIERGFADYAFERAPTSVLGGNVEQAVESMSRAAGLIGLLGALAAIAYTVL